MQTIALNNQQSVQLSNVQNASLSTWFQKIVAGAEENRFGVMATIILLQTCIAGFNIVIPALMGASVLLMAPGIVMTFVSNSIALAQVAMKYVIICFTLSVIINITVGVYCFFQLY